MVIRITSAFQFSRKWNPQTTSRWRCRHIPVVVDVNVRFLYQKYTICETLIAELYIDLCSKYSDSYL